MADQVMTGRHPSRTLLALSAAFIAVLATVAVAVETGQESWPLVGSVTTGRIDFAGRAYERGDRAEEIQDGFVRVGTTAHGGDIYGEPGASTSTPVLIQVTQDDDIYWYGLVGGP